MEPRADHPTRVPLYKPQGQQPFQTPLTGPILTSIQKLMSLFNGSYTIRSAAVAGPFNFVGRNLIEDPSEPSHIHLLVPDGFQEPVVN